MYNRAAFREAAVPYPSRDWDLDEFLAAARKLTLERDGDGHIDQYGFHGILDRSLFGASFISDDGQRSLCTTPAMIDYLQTNLDLAATHQVATPPRRATDQALDVYSMFRQRRMAMFRTVTPYLPELLDRCADMDWDIALNPTVRQRGQWASSQAVVISAATRHPREAWRLCKAFLTPAFQKRIAALGLAPNRAVAAEVVAEHTGRPEHLALLLAAGDALYPTPRVPYLQELRTHWLNGCMAVFAQRATPEAAMARAHDDITAAIAKKKRYKR